MRQEQTGAVCKTAQNNLRKIDTEAIRLHIRGILQALGDDPDREGLKETPERVAKMYEEVFEGMCYSNQEIADMFRKNFDMKVSVAYIPRGNVLGLSKIARIADMVGKRLQLQERIGSDIAEIMELVTDSQDVAVMIEGCHSCMTARGIRKSNAVTTTTTLRGRFKTDPMLQMNLFQQLHAGR